MPGAVVPMSSRHSQQLGAVSAVLVVIDSKDRETVATSERPMQDKSCSFEPLQS